MNQAQNTIATISMITNIILFVAWLRTSDKLNKCEGNLIHLRMLKNLTK